ncbi:hypothetical protein [Frankia sp. R82]|uniref:FDXHR family putative zinc-binding protein n=1 Tax=Frankia sp. R82 TaxID=2950553 RepID=UPI00204436C6|nr:hypothetical protein [Frankia sp. R82]MCM3886651.1 hypothetical protein [Frankia sp. R82]
MTTTGRPPASCGSCPARWSGLAAAHCPTCHATFAAASWFDAHRRGGACLPPAGLLGPDGRLRLRLDDTGMWRGADPYPIREAA